jgi:hypothetical protein
MRHRLNAPLVAASLATTLAAATPALAWNNQGHMATGAIAYDALMRADPAVVQKVLALTAALPQRQRMDAAIAGLTGPARDRAVFEYLARWPDDIRRGPLDRPDWHYAVHIVSPGWTLIPYTAGKARQAYDGAMATLEDPRASARDKAIAIAWVMHLAGDTQQPLHAGNRLAFPDFPKSDRAGTIGYVRTAPGAPPRSLHDAWDGAADLPGADKPAADALTAKLEQRGLPPLGPVGPLRHGYDAAFRSWWRESYHLAVSVAYTGDALKEAPTPAKAPVLSQAYVDRARGLAEPRIRLGGLRAAASLAASLDPNAR